CDRLPYDILPKRHMLVIINPASGRRRAHEIFKEQVVPLLEEGEITWEVVLSKEKNFVYNYIRSVDLSVFNNIVSVSGDGLVYEMVNGLLARSDWREAIKIPVGVIPGGSGNGLAFSLNEALGEPTVLDCVTSSVLNVIKGDVQKKHIILLQTVDDSVCSLSSFLWGVIADIVLDSEVLRFLGEVRYGLTGTFKSLSPSKYKGRLSFLRATEENRVKMARARKATADRLNHNQFSNNKLTQYLYEDQSFIGSTSCHNNPLLHSTKFNDLKENHASSSGSLWKTETSLLPTWDQHVSEDWETIEGEFYVIGCSYVSRLSTYLALSPSAKFDDDTIWLILVRGHVPRVLVMHFLIAMRSGKHVNCSFVDMIPILAFRLIPFEKKGGFAVDGEYMECRPVQGEILPFSMEILSR
ncbi:sphingosine kinase 2-like, partial [Limulus polyphemus]|uniref:Sphingosine kinase 2-like n=1 Tax=Limulus polyphemus TaxID=6850 RepID=A0ABM1C096_LIMPO